MGIEGLIEGMSGEPVGDLHCRQRMKTSVERTVRYRIFPLNQSIVSLTDIEALPGRESLIICEVTFALMVFLNGYTEKIVSTKRAGVLIL